MKKDYTPTIIPPSESILGVLPFTGDTRRKTTVYAAAGLSVAQFNKSLTYLLHEGILKEVVMFGGVWLERIR